MWHEIDLEALEDADYACAQPALTVQEMEQLVVFVRLHLYNRGRPCGADALRRRLRNYYHLQRLPSRHRVARILVAVLTVGGWYDGEDLDWLPASSHIPPEERRHY